MPCPSASVQFDQHKEVADLLEIHPFTAKSLFVPHSREELVKAVMDSGSTSLRAFGGKYALSRAAVAENAVDMQFLNQHVSRPYGAVTSLASGRIRPTKSDFLSKAVSHDRRLAGRCFVHVEGGLKINKLLEDLYACGLDLPTMGAGGNQTLIGATSTGTHGADFLVPILSDWIRALHLVSAGGREWWITPTSGPFGGPSTGAVPECCADTRMIADDDIFDTARVAVGRMGIIYAVVLEVLPAYGLLETFFEEDWSQTRARLASSNMASGVPTGLFDHPFTDLDSGWFREEVRKRTLVKYRTATPNPSEADVMEYVGGPPRPLALVSPSLETPLYEAMLSKLGLTGLAKALWGSGPRPLHSLNISISLADTYRCWIRRRWKVPVNLPSVLDIPSPPLPPNKVENAARDSNNKRKPTALIGPMTDEIEEGMQLAFELGQIHLIPELTRLAQTIMPEICRRHEQAGRMIGEALFMVLYRMATLPGLAPLLMNRVLSTSSELVGGNQVKRLLRCGRASQVLDTHDYTTDGALSGNSAEFFFDAAQTDYMSFIDTVINLCDKYKPVLGYMGIRLMPGSSALIAMQQYPRTISVEVATIASRLADQAAPIYGEDVYLPFWIEVHARANELGAIAHWGQEFFGQRQGYMERRYGSRMTRWRKALGVISDGAPATFSTLFSQRLGLEPIGGAELPEDDSVDLFFAGLQSAW